MRRAIADWSACAAALAVLAFGGLVVVKPAVDHWNDLYRGNPFEVRTTTERVVKERAGKDSRTTITRGEAPGVFVERGLGDSGLLFLRLALVALTALLLAAVVQRAILGDYGLRLRSRSGVASGSAPGRGRSSGAADRAEPSQGTAPNGTTPLEDASGGSLAPVIARLVASRREALGLSQRELAKRAGVSHTVISRIESGDHSPSRRTLELLTEALDARP